MRRLSLILMVVTLTVANGCMATRKFVRTEVKDSSDTLNTRIDKTDSEVAEVKDGVSRVDGRVTAVDGKVGALDGRVTQLDSKTNERFVSVKDDINSVDKKAATANATTQSNVSTLDQKFQNRNQFSVASEKAVLFRFDSAKLDSKYETDLEQVGSLLQQNADAIVVLEGRTDSKGDSEYNVKLGERRIDSVRRYLAVQLGIPVFKIHEISYGSAKPVAENNSREGREKNRAVVVTILVPKSTGSNN
jgi:outer membrane protein OmpA-like peptidoglycan-associated protein